MHVYVIDCTTFVKPILILLIVQFYLLEQPQIIINPPSSQIRAPVGSQLPLYCIAVKGYPIPVVQWHSKGIPVHPLSQPYQQIYLVPTDSPHTTTYTCVGTTFEHGSQEINVTVIVESEQLKCVHM